MATLTSEIERIINEINEKYTQDMILIDSVDELKLKMVELEMALEHEKDVETTPIDQSFIARIFRRDEYRTAISRREEATSNIQRLREEINELSAKIEETQIRLADIEAERESVLARIHGGDVVELCVSNNPDLLSDLEFMKSCIDGDLRNINLSNNLSERENDELFAYFAECYKSIYFDVEEMEKEGYDQRGIKEIVGAVDYVIHELIDPKSVADGKYKIPHKYLRESIVSNFNLFDEQLGKNNSVIDSTFFSNIARNYATYDGSLSVEYGEALAEMCDDPSCYVYMHYVGYKGEYKNEGCIPVCESICETGLMIPTSGTEFGKPCHTTLNTDSDRNMTLLDFMNYWCINHGVVVLKVPKAVVDGNEPYIGWKINSDGKESYEELYMFPEYVVGYTSNCSFIRNPIPLQQREEAKVDMFSRMTTDASRANITAYSMVKRD